jgi:ATP-binding cassette subfamily B protein
MLIVIIGGLVILNPLLTVASLISMGIIYGVVVLFSRERYRQNSTIAATESTKAIRAIHEGIGGIRDVIIDGSQEAYCNIYEEAIRALRQAQANNLFLANSPRFIFETLGLVAIAFATILISSSSNGILTAIPILGVLAMAVQRLLPLIQQLYASWAAIKGAEFSLADVLVLLNQKTLNLTPDNSIRRLPFSKNIQVQNVSFRYDSDTPDILKNVSINIVKGSRVGIIGKTGMGKSTLLDLIIGLLVPTAGIIIIDDVLLSNDNRKSWQRCIAHVPQVVFLADSTIKDNIIFGSGLYDIDMGRLIEAARQAQLIDFIESLPKGFDTPIGERGVRLSGGQRQRMGIARALYRQADVLVFDEATNALDHQTELEVMKAIEALDRDITIIMIAHRLTTLNGCDQIIDIASF